MAQRAAALIGEMIERTTALVRVDRGRLSRRPGTELKAGSGRCPLRRHGGLFLQGALWANVLLTTFIASYVRRQLQTDAAGATTISMLGFLSQVALWSLVVLLILANLGIDVTALIAGLGIGGVAIALAAQNVLGDLLGSLSIVLDKPFVLGDFIIIEGFMGTVEHIGLKTTRVRSLSGEQLVFANNDLLRSRIRNFKRMQERRVLFTLG